MVVQREELRICRQTAIPLQTVKLLGSIFTTFSSHMMIYIMYIPYDDIYHVYPIWWYLSYISRLMIFIVRIYPIYPIYPSRQISPIWCQRACRHIFMVPSLDGGFYGIINIILQIILFITLSQLLCLYLNRISLLFALAFFATSLLSNSFWKNNFSCQGFPPVPFWCLPKSFCFW